MSNREGARLGAAVLAVVMGIGLGMQPQMAEAGTINRACLQSERKNVTPALCQCIEGVAKRTLSRSERRTAAKFFRDPDRAQEMRFSDRPQDDAFWERYELFSKRVAASCK